MKFLKQILMTQETNKTSSKVNTKTLYLELLAIQKCYCFYCNFLSTFLK